jgi:ABC-2 type transport system ATP-binding protein
MERKGADVIVTGTGELVNAVILTLAVAGVTAHDVQLDSSNLEDAFVKLTGRRLYREGATA